MKIITLVKSVLVVLFSTMILLSCSDATDADNTTVEEETTNIGDQMKVVQPVIDSAHNTAADGDSSLLKDDTKEE